MSLAKFKNAIILDGSDDVANKDLIPMPPLRRLWGWQSFAGLWTMSGLCFSAWTAASSLLSLGLNVPHTIGVIIISNLLITFLAVLCGQIGSDWHIGYTMTQRVVYGNKWGALVTVLVRIILSIVWFASGSWTGALCINCMLGALSHNYLHMENNIPASVNMTQQELIGFIIYLIITCILFFIKPEKLGKHLVACSIVTFFVSLGLVSWAVKDAGGNGPLVSSKLDLTRSQLAWAWLSGISSFYGSMASGIANQNDYARFSRTRDSAKWSVHISFNVFGLVIPVMGIIAASAMLGKYGEEFWMPNDIITFWLTQNYSAKLRAGAFFAGGAFAYSQLIYNAVGNAYGGGMDLSGLFPKLINIRRGCFIVMLLAWPVQPWLMYNSSSIFSTVMSSFSVFLTPLIAVLICDYWFIRHRKIKLKDLYNLEPDSIYHYYHQVNLRAVLAWLLGLVWLLPGFVAATKDTYHVSQGWVRMYELNWIVGFFLSFFLYYLFCLIWPMQGMGEIDDYDYFNSFTLEECEKLGMTPFSQEIYLNETNEELKMAVAENIPELETEKGEIAKAAVRVSVSSSD